MTNDPHVRWRLLVDRRDGRLSPRRAAGVDEHLVAGCAPCGEAVRAIERLVSAIADGPPAHPPARWETAAIRLFRETYADSAKDVDAVAGVLLLDRADEFAVALRAAPGE